jgi:hypothetical protein
VSKILKRLCALQRVLQWGNRKKRSKKLGRGEGDGKRKYKDKVEDAEGRTKKRNTEYYYLQNYLLPFVDSFVLGLIKLLLL